MFKKCVFIFLLTIANFAFAARSEEYFHTGDNACFELSNLQINNHLTVGLADLNMTFIGHIYSRLGNSKNNVVSYESNIKDLVQVSDKVVPVVTPLENGEGYPKKNYTDILTRRLIYSAIHTARSKYTPGKIDPIAPENTGTPEVKTSFATVRTLSLPISDIVYKLHMKDGSIKKIKLKLWPQSENYYAISAGYVFNHDSLSYSVKVAAFEDDKIFFSKCGILAIDMRSENLEIRALFEKENGEVIELDDWSSVTKAFLELTRRDGSGDDQDSELFQEFYLEKK